MTGGNDISPPVQEPFLWVALSQADLPVPIPEFPDLVFSGGSMSVNHPRLSHTFKDKGGNNFNSAHQQILLEYPLIARLIFGLSCC